MAKEKNTPNLPGSSRMQMPSTGTGSSQKLAINQNSKGATSKVMSGAKGKGMKSSNSYC
jgi:hypothetical protein